MNRRRQLASKAVRVAAACWLLTTPMPQLTSAQERRISSEPPITVPAGLRIQSAATIGGTTYAVWGSTGASGDARRDSLLVGQAIVDGVPIGTPLRLTDSAAAPSHYVWVAAFDSSFVVFWSDRRGDSAGAWGRAIGLDGLPIGPARRLAAVRALSDSVVSTIQDRQYVTLAWPLANSALGLLTVDHLARPVSFDSVASASVALAQSLASIGALPIRTEEGTRFVRPDGSSLRSPHLIDTAVRAALVRGDGSLVVLRDSVMTIYANWADTVPSRRVAVGPMGRAIRSRFALLDVAGGIGVDRLVEAQTGNAGGLVYQLILTRAVVADATSRFDSLAFSNVATQSQVAGWSVNHSSGSDPIQVMSYLHGGYAARMHVWESYFNPRTGMRSEWSGYLGFDVQGDGTWIGSDSAPPSDINLGAPAAPRIVRLTDSMRSTIAVGVDSVSLSTGIIVTGSYASQSHPVVYRMAGRLRVGWVDSVSTDRGVQPWIGRADLSGAAGLSANRHVDVPSLVNPLDTRIFRTHGGLVLVPRTEDRTRNPAEYQMEIVHEVLHKHYGPVQYWWPFASVDHEPDSDMLSVVTIVSNGLTDARVRCDDTLVRQVSAAAAGFSGRPLPLAGSRLLFIDSPSVYLLDSCKLTRSFETPPQLAGRNMLRLRGNQILAWSYVDTCQCIRFDRFRFEEPPSRIVHLATGWVHAGGTDVSVVEVPEDSSLVVLAGGQGVVLHRLSKRLSPVGTPMRITEGTQKCARPYGMFVDGSLLAVWEDYRTTLSDIYGTTLLVETFDEPPLPSTESHDATVRVAPNPAHDELRVVMGMDRAESVTCELFDQSGRLVATQSATAPPTGSVTFFFRTRFLPNGMYLVRTRRGQIVGHSSALVIHPR